jgi:hypothetical protein
MILVSKSILSKIYYVKDELLRRAVAEHGGRSWKAIAEHFCGERTDVQCLHRWQKVLNPDLVKGPWTLAVRSSYCLLRRTWLGS